MGSGSQVVILALAVVVNRSGSPDDDDDQEGPAVSLEPSTNQPSNQGELDRCNCERWD